MRASDTRADGGDALSRIAVRNPTCIQRRSVAVAHTMNNFTSPIYGKKLELVTRKFERANSSAVAGDSNSKKSF